jgi:hypothetical protein
LVTGLATDAIWETLERGGELGIDAPLLEDRADDIGRPATALKQAGLQDAASFRAAVEGLIGVNDADRLALAFAGCHALGLSDVARSITASLWDAHFAYTVEPPRSLTFTTVRLLLALRPHGAGTLTSWERRLLLEVFA